MANETPITVIGRAAGDAELRFTPAGKAVCNVTVATNQRFFNKQTSEWENGPATFYRVQCWDQMAENVAESVVKGQPLIVNGYLSNREWEDKDGNKRLSLEVNAQAIGPDLRWGIASFSKTAKSVGGGGQRQERPAADDPFAGGVSSQPSGWDSAPPF